MTKLSQVVRGVREKSKNETSKAVGVEELLDIMKNVYTDNGCIWYESIVDASIHKKVCQAIADRLRNGGE